MFSVFRKQTPALWQWLEIAVVRSHVCHRTRQSQCQLANTSCFSSRVNKEDDGAEPTVTRNDDIVSDRLIGKRRERKPAKEDTRRLHTRILSTEEREQDVLLERGMPALPEQELFGNLNIRTSNFAKQNYRQRNFPRESRDTAKSFQMRKSTQVKSDTKEFRNHQDNQFSNQFSSTVSHAQSQQTHKRQNSLNTDMQPDSWANNFGTMRKELDNKWVEDNDYQTKDANSSENDYLSSDDEDVRPFRRLTDDGRYSANWYGRQMRDFADQGKIKEAIDVLDVWMLKNDRVKPNYYVFSMLISILGRAGYTKKAFQVFNQMKKMGVKPKDNTYTALFNCCSNSPWHGDGLQRTRNLHAHMVEKKHRPNLVTYRAMIKAYGVCGDLATAFSLLSCVDERFTADIKCYSFLLMACCSDREAGFSHAVRVWRLLRQRGLQPNLYLYNLLLRVIRDCGVGDIKTAAKLIHNSLSAQQHLDVHSSPSPQQQLQGGEQSRNYKPTGRLQRQTGDVIERKQRFSNSRPLTSNRTDGEYMSATFYNRSQQEFEEGQHGSRNKQFDLDIDDDKGQLSSSWNAENIPEIMNVDIEADKKLENVTVKEDIAGKSSFELSVSSPVLPSVLDSPIGTADSSLVSVNLNLLGTAEARLMLVGGVEGILGNMSADGVVPDIKTLSQLVNSIPSNEQAESQLIDLLTEQNIQPDVDFFNMLIRKRNLRRDHRGARALLTLIGEHKLLANMSTFGCLAMGCRRRADGRQLLTDMQAYGLSPNQAIFTILVYNSGDDFQYKLELIREMQGLDVLPSDKLIMYIENRLHVSKKAIVDQERGREVLAYYKSDYFHNGYKKFMRFYSPWLKRTHIEKEEHPWAKFRHPPVEEESKTVEEEEGDSYVRTV